MLGVETLVSGTPINVVFKQDIPIKHAGKTVDRSMQPPETVKGRRTSRLPMWTIIILTGVL